MLGRYQMDAIFSAVVLRLPIEQGHLTHGRIQAPADSPLESIGFPHQVNSMRSAIKNYSMPDARPMRTGTEKKIKPGNSHLHKKLQHVGNLGTWEHPGVPDGKTIAAAESSLFNHAVIKPGLG